MQAPSKTASGETLEGMLLGIVQRNGYSARTQQIIGLSLGGGKHRIDLLLTLPDRLQIPVSAKWQQVSGTAKEKVPFEVIKLIHAVRTSDGRFPYAYLVLAGTDWGTLRSFYMGGGLAEYIQGIDLVRIVSLEDFMARANRRRL